MDKKTKNNPAAFQKIPPLRFLKLIKNTVQKVVNGQYKGAINIFRAGLLNYFLKFKRKNQFYCNLCKCESPNFLHTANESRILFNSICPNCSSRKRHRGLNELYKNILTEFDSPKILHFAPEPVFFTTYVPPPPPPAFWELWPPCCPTKIFKTSPALRVKSPFILAHLP